MGALSTKEKARLYDYLRSEAWLEYDWNGPSRWVIVIMRDDGKLSDNFSTAVKQAIEDGGK